MTCLTRINLVQSRYALPSIVPILLRNYLRFMDHPFGGRMRFTVGAERCASMALVQLKAFHNHRSWCTKLAPYKLRRGGGYACKAKIDSDKSNKAFDKSKYRLSEYRRNFWSTSDLRAISLLVFHKVDLLEFASTPIRQQSGVGR